MNKPNAPVAIGQTWRLANGEIVTVTRLPDADGWLLAYSHDTEQEGTYGIYGFVQPGAKLIEHVAIRNMIEDIVREVLAEQQKPKRSRRSKK